MPNQEDILANADEKARLLQQQVDDKDARIQELLEEKEQLMKKLEDLERDTGNSVSMKD